MVNEEMKKYYTGIGSRETPPRVLMEMEAIAILLEKEGYTLRSGGAPGADEHFELCVQNKEIFLPWERFNNNPSNLHNVTEEAVSFSLKFHPAPERLSPAAKKLMGRNAYQVMGRGLDTPSEFVICWTKDGKDSGGTGQAIRIARHYGIPVYNLKNETWTL